MATYVEAPKKIDGPEPYIFLAGGITGCENWQSRARHALAGECSNQRFTILNPRRSRTTGKSIRAIRSQVQWEYKATRAADLIAFWFSPETLNPIALFELGVHSVRATAKSDTLMSYPAELIVGCDPEYKRRNDVKIQLELSNPGIGVLDDFDDFLDEIIYWIGKHAEVT